MKNQFFKAVALGLLFLHAQAGDLSLRSYQWKNRVLVLEDSEKDSAQIQKAQKQLKAHKKDILERDLVILTRGGQSDFKIRLIGKDGGQKWQSGPDFKTQTIFDLIDSMPMRQQEMKNE